MAGRLLLSLATVALLWAAECRVAGRGEDLALEGTIPRRALVAGERICGFGDAKELGGDRPQTEAHTCCNGDVSLKGLVFDILLVQPHRRRPKCRRRP